MDYTVRICLKGKLMGVGEGRQTETYWEDIPLVICGALRDRKQG